MVKRLYIFNGQVLANQDKISHTYPYKCYLKFQILNVAGLKERREGFPPVFIGFNRAISPFFIRNSNGNVVFNIGLRISPSTNKMNREKMIEKPTVNGTNGIMLDVSYTFPAKLRNRLVLLFNQKQKENHR